MAKKNTEKEKKKKNTEKEQDAPEITSDGSAAVARDEAKTEATVVDVNGNAARTYTKAEHGDDFRKLAEEFASKREGWSVR